MAINPSDPTKTDIGLLYEDTLTADGSTTWRRVPIGFTTVTLYLPAGAGSTIYLECSYDAGATAAGVAPRSLTVADDTTGNITFPIYEEEKNVLYRMTMTGYTSGTAKIRFSGGNPAVA